MLLVYCGGCVVLDIALLASKSVELHIVLSRVQESKGEHNTMISMLSEREYRSKESLYPRLSAYERVLLQSRRLEIMSNLSSKIFNIPITLLYVIQSITPR